MEYFAIGLAIMQLLTFTHQMTMRFSRDIPDASSDELHEQLESKINSVQKDMQNEIMDQNRTLGLLLQLSQTNEVLTRKLMNHCRSKLKTTDKSEIFLPNRRSNSNYENSFQESSNLRRSNANDGNTFQNFDNTLEQQKKEDPPIVSIVKFGKRMPKLSRLFLDVISNEFSTQFQPILDAAAASTEPRVVDTKT